MSINRMNKESPGDDLDRKQLLSGLPVKCEVIVFSTEDVLLQLMYLH